MLRHKRLQIGAIAILNVLSLVVLTASWSLIKTPEQVLAAGSGYSATWEITQCRVVGNKNIPLGPAGWKVTYSLPNDKQIIETWTATGWRNVSENINTNGYRTTYATVDGSACRTPGRTGTGKGVISLGGYGWTLFGGTSTDAGSSSPTGWTVTTTIQ